MERNVGILLMEAILRHPEFPISWVLTDSIGWSTGSRISAFETLNP